MLKGPIDDSKIGSISADGQAACPLWALQIVVLFLQMAHLVCELSRN